MRTLPIIASALALGLAACAPSHQGGYYDPDYSGSNYGGHTGPAVVEDAYVGSHDEAIVLADTRGVQFDEVQILNNGQRQGYHDGNHGYDQTSPAIRYSQRYPFGRPQGRESHSDQSGSSHGVSGHGVSGHGASGHGTTRHSVASYESTHYGHTPYNGPYGPGLDHDAPVPSPNSEDVGIGPAQVAETQATLRQLGFDPGRTDGVYGPATKNAIIAYTTHQGMPTDGAVNHSLMSYLRSDLSARIRAQSRMSGGQHHY